MKGMVYTDFTLEGALERFELRLEVQDLLEPVVPPTMPH
jgi:hypothetical protein